MKPDAHAQPIQLRDAVSQLTSSSDRMALVDEGGRIAAINAAWREHAGRAGGSVATSGRGADFLAACDAAAAAGDHGSAEVAAALRSVMAREATALTLRLTLDGPGLRSGACSASLQRVQGPLENWFLVAYSATRADRALPTALPELGVTLGSGLSHVDVLREMDAVASHVALLDTEGTIFAVNAAWRRYAREAGASDAATGPGADYLAVCERAVRAGDRRGAQFADGLRSVLGGQRRSWWLDSRVNVHGEVRLFRGRVTRVDSPDGPFVIVAHSDLSTPNVLARAA